jgi:hypothetical protein
MAMQITQYRILTKTSFFDSARNRAQASTTQAASPAPVVFLFCFWGRVSQVPLLGWPQTHSLLPCVLSSWDFRCAQPWPRLTQQFTLFFLEGGTGAWTQGLHLEPLHQPFFVMGFFEIGSRKLFPWAGLILLISAFWVARIYRCEPPAPSSNLNS